MGQEAKNSNEAQTKIEVKYQPPSRFDNASYGQIWKVIGENESVSYWAQVSRFEIEPCWKEITFYFDSTFQELLRTEEFRELTSYLL